MSFSKALYHLLSTGSTQEDWLNGILRIETKNLICYLLGCSFTIVFCFCFVFVALRPMSTAMVIEGRSVHLTTLFPGQA